MTTAKVDFEDLESEEVIDQIAESVRADLGGSFPLERVRIVAREVAQEFQHATVRAYLPMIISRRTRERLLDAS